MKIVAKRRKGYAHSLTAGRHTLIGDEPQDKGGTDSGPTPGQLLAMSLASCTAITVEMYADRKKWGVGDLEVEVDYEFGETDVPTRYEVVLRLPGDLTDEQVERLRVIAGKCPVHRALIGDVEIDDRVERMPN
ncbi:MAG: osmotically inducible protein OsmC [Candidatus Rokuibacteriota bacterium]|nr:MAG: osmotically inducible protein OsmC [Candidatus Rokubacteria bacterium]